MPYNGSGNFSAPSASFPAVGGALIESAKFNNIVNDIASGLSTAITKDGQTTIASNLPMSGYRFTGVGDAVARSDYASAGQVQDGGFLYAGTAGGTANAITLTLTPPIAAYATGQSFMYKSGASANTGAMTVNINGVGAKAIQKNGAALSLGYHRASRWFRITYDGTAFQVEKVGDIEGPAFSAYASSSQSVFSGIPSKVSLGTEEFDTDSCFASSRFTPNVAGYYSLTGVVSGASASLSGGAAFIYKNGSAFRSGTFSAYPSTLNGTIQCEVGALVYLNGTTDYVELYGVVNGGSPTFDYVSSSDTSWMSGFLARAA